MFPAEFGQSHQTLLYKAHMTRNRRCRKHYNLHCLRAPEASSKKALFLKVFRRGQHGPPGGAETYIYIRIRVDRRGEMQKSEKWKENGKSGVGGGNAETYIYIRLRASRPISGSESRKPCICDSVFLTTCPVKTVFFFRVPKSGVYIYIRKSIEIMLYGVEIQGSASPRTMKSKGAGSYIEVFAVLRTGVRPWKK